MKIKDLFFGIALALILAGAISPFASSHPDGLERVAEDFGFIQRAEVASKISAPLADYIWPKVKREWIATALAGGAGTILVFAAAYTVAFLIRRVS